MRRVLCWPLASLISLLAAACGGNVTVDPAGAGGAGTGAGGLGAGGSGVGGSGVGGAPDCSATHDSISFGLLAPDGQVINCANAEPGTSQTVTVQGKITQNDPAFFEIDSCPPNADCAPQIWLIGFDSPGFAASVVNGSFVELTLRVDYPFGCSDTILVRNLPVWGGTESSGGPLPILLFAGSEGSNGTLDGSPFNIDPIPLGCFSDEPQGCGKADNYALRFTQAAIPGDPGIVLGMGDTQTWDVSDQGTPALWTARNLKSFETGACDDYWNWAYWVTRTLPPE